MVKYNNIIITFYISEIYKNKNLKKKNDNKFRIEKYEKINKMI
jgi:hypothetical protein